VAGVKDSITIELKVPRALLGTTSIRATISKRAFNRAREFPVVEVLSEEESLRGNYGEHRSISPLCLWISNWCTDGWSCGLPCS
jgi:hypothetical protein